MFEIRSGALLFVALFVPALLLSGCDQAGVPGEQDRSDAERVPNPQQSAAKPQNPGIQGLNAVRNTTEEYKDVSVAEADGYKKFSVFVPNMGFHYLHESAINEDGTSDLDRRLNRTDPEILVYGDTEKGNSGQIAPNKEDFGAVEYAIPKKDGETQPPQHAIALFNNAGPDDWHVHPSVHELPLSDDWTVHGECHYEGGPGVFLAEKPNGDFVFWTPPTGAFGSWGGTIKPDACPESLGGNPLPPLLIVHGKWWTLHAWIWVDNPAGVFHDFNPRVQQ